MEKFITFIMSNFTLTFLVLGFIFAAVSLARKPKPLEQATAIKILFSYYLLFNIGIAFIYNFVCHVFFQETSAAFIGWANSPFQLEVGFASLGFGVIGIIAFWSGLGFRSAAVIGPALFTWGAAGGHIYQMIKVKNFAAGNAGIVFWSDIVIPVIGFILLYMQYKTEKSS